MALFSSTAPGVTGANDVPAPDRDDARNMAPPEAARRVAEFVKEDPHATFVFDSRRDDTAEFTELCRRRADGGISCIKIAVESKQLFKTMQAQGFYCALPAEPTRTHMECRALPRMN